MTRIVCLQNEQTQVFDHLSFTRASATNCKTTSFGPSVKGRAENENTGNGDENIILVAKAFIISQNSVLNKGRTILF